MGTWPVAQACGMPVAPDGLPDEGGPANDVESPGRMHRERAMDGLARGSRGQPSVSADKPLPDVKHALVQEQRQPERHAKERHHILAQPLGVTVPCLAGGEHQAARQWGSNQRHGEVARGGEERRGEQAG